MASAVGQVITEMEQAALARAVFEGVTEFTTRECPTLAPGAAVAAHITAAESAFRKLLK